MRDRTLLDIIEEGQIRDLTPMLKYSIWSLIRRGRSRTHLRMMVQSKTGKSPDLREACYTYIDRCVEALANGREYPV